MRRAAVLALALLAACVSTRAAGESGTSGLGGAVGAGVGLLAQLSGGMVTLLAFLGAAAADMWNQASGAEGGGIIDAGAVAKAFFALFLWPAVIILAIALFAPSPWKVIRFPFKLLRGGLRRLQDSAGDESKEPPIAEPTRKRTPRRAARGLRLPRD